jgi:CHAD domain-containing protein
MRNNADYLLLIAKQLNRLQRSRQALLSGCDTEALHDFRVQLRSLRTLLPLALSSKKQPDQSILRAWRGLAKLSNSPRDAEVMMDLLGKQIIAVQKQSLQQHYSIGIIQLKTILSSPQLQSLHHNTLQQAHLRLDLRRQLKRRIQQQQAKLRQSLLNENLTSTPSLNDWHHRRITIKQLRYLTELAADWSLASTTNLLPTLKTAQTALGHLQDKHTLTLWFANTEIHQSVFESTKRSWNKLITQLLEMNAPTLP